MSRPDSSRLVPGSRPERQCQAVDVETAAMAASEGQTATVEARLPDELRAELRRLLAQMLVEDVRRYPVLDEADREGLGHVPSGTRPATQDAPAIEGRRARPSGDDGCGVYSARGDEEER